MQESTRFRSPLSDEQWAAIKQRWETTPRLTFAELSRTNDVPVSAQAVSQRARREGWTKRTVYKAGRPTAYKSEFDEQVYKLALLGATDKEITDFFDVTERTINNWKQNQLSFFQSLKEGKMSADAKVAQALYSRATGYSHEDTHIAVVDGEIVQTSYIKNYPPCAASAIFWLKNRQPTLWKDKVEVKEEVNLSVFPSKEKLDAIYSKALAEAESIEEGIIKGRAERLGIDLDGMEANID